ncbi:hypothetical protein [Tepidiphilus succinatimandens]|jgi:hypothetical protein|uniref:hypothetical protein n=1 Tax=Tepidiphilus succinatimandens TaxID=224436 RepID=UPI00112F1EE9|nr:hypothetical protein [Tepidiphilus succinatimandens]
MEEALLAYTLAHSNEANRDRQLMMVKKFKRFKELQKMRPRLFYEQIMCQKQVKKISPDDPAPYPLALRHPRRRPPKS